MTMTGKASDHSPWILTDRARGLDGFLATAELTLQVRERGGRLYACAGVGEVVALIGRDSLLRAGGRRRSGLDPRRACCIVAGRSRPAPTLRRAGRPSPWRPRPFSPFPQIAGHRTGSGLSARDWSRYG